MFWGAWATHAARNLTVERHLGLFLTDYIAGVGVGLTALFASIALPRIRRRDMTVLFGACLAGVLFIYLPSLLKAWPVLRSKGIAVTALASFSFPFALVAIAAIAALLGRRRIVRVQA